MRHRLLLYGMLFVGGCSAVVLPFGLTVNSAGTSGEPLPDAVLSERIHVPEGFTISSYAVGIDNARMMRFTRSGDLLVSSPRTGKVFLLERDGDGDGHPDGIRVLLEGLKQPHGLALSNDNLYVAETDTVFSVPFDQETGATTGAIDRIIRGIPGGGQHWTRTIGIGPDGYLYLSIGSDCNVCIEDDPRRAAISRYDLDGTNGRVYATGLRNAVGFTWQPSTHAMYATDNGRDFLGDDFPPCELVKVVDGGFYGWPYANGDNVPDPDYGDADKDKLAAALPPAHSFGAHTAPLGISFYSDNAFPQRYNGAAFVALHGSWNRSTKSGYKVVALFFGDDGSVTQEDFAVGFEKDNDVVGRPVDIVVGPDHALYVSDDYTGSIYRIAYGAAAAEGTAPSAPASQPAPSRLGVGTMDPRLLAVALSRGRALWTDNGCAACHEEGGGDNYRPLAGLREKYDVASLMAYLLTPQPPMPVFPLGDFERRDLSIFLLDRYP